MASGSICVRVSGPPSVSIQVTRSSARSRGFSGKIIALESPRHSPHPPFRIDLTTLRAALAARSSRPGGRSLCAGHPAAVGVLTPDVSGQGHFVRPAAGAGLSHVHDVSPRTRGTNLIFRCTSSTATSSRPVSGSVITYRWPRRSLAAVVQSVLSINESCALCRGIPRSQRL